MIFRYSAFILLCFLSLFLKEYFPVRCVLFIVFCSLLNILYPLSLFFFLLSQKYRCGWFLYVILLTVIVIMIFLKFLFLVSSLLEFSLSFSSYPLSFCFSSSPFPFSLSFSLPPSLSSSFLYLSIYLFLPNELLHDYPF